MSGTISMWLLQLLFPAVLCLLVSLQAASTLAPTAAPLFPDRPFMAIWNAPTHKCKQSAVPLDMSAMQADTTPAAVPNQLLTLFYKNRLGLYPYTDMRTFKESNGGLPQRGNLTAHLIKARADITKHIPESSPGLAVIDWEEWLPLFDRNQDEKEWYRNLSCTYSAFQRPRLSPHQVVIKAKQQFQKAARSYMEDTLSLGIRERPLYRWGFYLFPDCYNYNSSEAGYTGRCSGGTQKLNDELVWLWNMSTALFPSAYLWTALSGRHAAAQFVRNQVQEAVRVSALPERPYTAPVYLYSRPVFGDQNHLYLSETDLISSIGESAALGASGAVLWGSSADFTNKASCEALSLYLSGTLNPYIANVTGAARLCSNMLCEGKGRCVRKNYDSDDYLHLNPMSFRIEKRNGKYQSAGRPALADLTALADKFTCQCYAGQQCSDQTSFHIPQTEMTFQV